MNATNGQRNVGGGAAVGSIEPQQPIPRAIDLLSGSVNQLDSDLNILAERMHRVLRPVPPAAPAPAPHGGLAAVAATSQVYEQIGQQNDRVERLSLFVRDLLDRLEA